MVPSEASVCASSSYLGWSSQGRPTSSAKHATTRDPARYLSRSNRFRCPPVTDGQTDTQTDNYNFSTRDTNTQIMPRACVLRGVFIRWNGTVEWNGGMERWNGIVEWNGGMTTPIEALL